jgi:HK97 family phage prohead protease
LEYKEINLDLKMEDGEGTIVGYGAVFGNVDRGGDRIIKGAFTRSLDERMPKMVWQHDMGDPIGRWTEVREDDKGLYVKGKLTLGATKGRDVYELLKDGALDGLSIGYATRQSDMNGDVRDLKEIDLYEVSPVTLAMNEMASVTHVKDDAHLTARDIERAFRDTIKKSHGVSNSAIKAMAGDAMDRYGDILREAGVSGPECDQREVDELKQRITNFRKLLKGESA